MYIRTARVQTDIPAVTHLIDPYARTSVTEEQARCRGIGLAL